MSFLFQESEEDKEPKGINKSEFSKSAEKLAKDFFIKNKPKFDKIEDPKNYSN